MRVEEVRQIEAQYAARYHEDPVFHAQAHQIADAVRSCLPDFVGEEYGVSIKLAGLVAAGLLDQLESVAPPRYRDILKLGAFRVPGEPVSKERPRLGKEGKTYTPAKTKEAEEAVGWAAMAGLRKGALTSDRLFRVDVTFVVHGSFWSKDIDNMCKTILDGMNKVVYADDKQVVILNATKQRCDAAENPHTIVEVWEVEKVSGD